MKALLQRVSKASVTVDGEVVGHIGFGLLVFLGISRGDTESDAQYPGPVRNAIRVKMQGIDYPLWALRYCEELDSSIRNFLLCVDIFLKDREEEAESILQDSRLQTGNYSHPVSDTETRSQNGNCKQPGSVSEAISLVLKQYHQLFFHTRK